jgi:uncharacterized membrane protein YphA (DoxX/SURF4 family)
VFILSKRLQLPVRRIVGALFVVTGAFKIALWSRFIAFCAAVPAQVLEINDPQVLALARVAMLATAIIVPPLEVVCGVLLWRGKYLRVAASLLALNMAGAIITVGIPGRLGKSIGYAGIQVGAEPWRLPLEVLLLLACVWLALRTSATAQQDS